VILRRGRSWQNTLRNCDRITYENVKVISFGNSGDGINPVGSRDVAIRDCFLRCTDDCIAIKSPDERHAVERVRVLDNTLIGYAFADGVTIGFETNGPHVRDVLFDNCSVAGKPLQGSEDASFEINEHIRDVRFRHDAGD
jgi:polygalacturonase